MTAREDKPANLERYAALSNFLRGYLHEDSALDYPSAEAAAQAFLKEAGEREATMARSELEHLLKMTSALPEAQLIRILERDLGCRRHFSSRKQVEQLKDALK